MENYKSFLVLIALFGFGSAQLTVDGKCPTITHGQENFTGEKFLGRWYEHHNYPGNRGAHSCTKYDLHALINGSVEIDGTSYSYVTKKTISSIGIATPIGPAHWDVKFPKAEVSGIYWLLRTNYEKYAVVYACKDIEGNKMVEDLKILTRTRFVPLSVIDEAIEIIKQNKISPEYLSETKQTACIDEEE